MVKNNLINLKVKGNLIGVMRVGEVEYISLTDIARYKNPNTPNEVVKIGDYVNAKITSIDVESKKIELSMKALEEEKIEE